MRERIAMPGRALAMTPCRSNIKDALEEAIWPKVRSVLSLGPASFARQESPRFEAKFTLGHPGNVPGACGRLPSGARTDSRVALHCGQAGSRLSCVSQAELDPEDLKIVTLARSARARVGSAEGAAVRDETGRTYAAATVALPSLQLSALALAVAMAVSSGAAALEAAALVSDDTGPAPADIATVRDIGSKAVIILAGSDGRVRQTIRP
jgi:hypothetical protein